MRLLKRNHPALGPSLRPSGKTCISRETPLPYPANIHMYEIRNGINSDPAFMQRERCSLQNRQAASGDADVHGFGLHMHAVLCNARRMLSQEFIRRGSTIPADDVEGLVRFEFLVKLIQQIEKSQINGLHCVAAIITEDPVNLLQGFGYILAIGPVNSFQAFTRMQVIKGQAFFSWRGSGYPCRQHPWHCQGCSCNGRQPGEIAPSYCPVCPSVA